MVPTGKLEVREQTINVYKNEKSIRETIEFALGLFDAKLSLQQKRLFYWVFSMVTKDEKPDAIYWYNISLDEMARYIDISDTFTFKRNISKVASELKKLNIAYNPPILYSTPDNHTNAGLAIFDQVDIDNDNPDTIRIMLTNGFRRRVIQMKEKYDLEFPLQAILQMSSPYAIDLYILLIGEVALQRDKHYAEGGDPVNSFVIELSREKLFRCLNYTGRTSDFNNRILPIILKNLESTEVLLNSDDPVIKRHGNRIISYTFHVRVHTTLENKIFAKTIIDYSIENSMPKMDYLIGKLESMGVGPSLIKKCRAQNDRSRIWGNYLYTLYCVGAEPKYFNAAYNKKYCEDATDGNANKMFALFIDEPSCYKYWKDDELMCSLKDYKEYKDHSFFDILREKIRLAEEKRKFGN